ncbi:hypothetical protein [uncultured Paracoccus sp.]|uniref:hypothetical protein n=1 Tax=uncultured Paracoccus sp. TaxID=189685 RepID=UPI002631FCB5|nr:hypothetical protein [uncultured Paracoccus sp.]
MRVFGWAAFGASGLLVLAFAANLVLVKSAMAPLFGNVAEMLVLFAASALFGAGTLIEEARAEPD